MILHLQELGKFRPDLLQFYNPDQPRAADGKWGEGDASATKDVLAKADKSFHRATPVNFINARDKSTRPEFMSPLTPDQLTDHKLFLNKAATVGVSVSKDGDIQNLFNNGGPKGDAAYAIVHAISEGGRTLDCYDGHLRDFYTQFGFEETARYHFDIQYAHNWDTEKNGTPDVVMMKWGGYPAGGPAAAVDRAMNKVPRIDTPHAKYLSRIFKIKHL